MAKRPRTDQREAERSAGKLARSRMKLSALEPGGAPDRPIEVTSASIIEPHASSMPCAACGAYGVRVDEHIAVTLEDSRRVRIVYVNCQRCGTRREIYFRIGTMLPS